MSPLRTVSFPRALRHGVVLALRSLPIARSAPLVGHVLGDLVKYVVALLIVFGFGALLGFRFHGSVARVLAGLVLVVAFALAVCWMATLIGTLPRTPPQPGDAGGGRGPLAPARVAGDGIARIRRGVDRRHRRRLRPGRRVELPPPGVTGHVA